MPILFNRAYNELPMIQHGNVWIQQGNVCVYDQDEIQTYRIPIGKVVVILEYPHNLEGIRRILRSEIFDRDENKICEDGDIVDNTDFFSKEEVKQAVREKYGYNGRIIIQ